MRWLLFAISLAALWFAFNVLFMVPGTYSATAFGLAGLGIVTGTVAAWFSGRQFTLAWGRDRRVNEIVRTPPVVLSIFILCVFCLIGAIKVLTYR
jgi:hypothetical protein